MQVIKKVIIPNSVKMIEAEAFAFCDGLEELILPAGTKVSESAFACCDHVKILVQSE